MTEVEELTIVSEAMEDVQSLLRGHFALGIANGKPPRSLIVVEVVEVYHALQHGAEYREHPNHSQYVPRDHSYRGCCRVWSSESCTYTALKARPVRILHISCVALFSRAIQGLSVGATLDVYLPDDDGISRRVFWRWQISDNVCSMHLITAFAPASEV